MAIGTPQAIMSGPNNGVASGGHAATNLDAPVGSLIVVFVTGWGSANASISAVTDSAGNTYSQLAQNTTAAGIFNGSIWICSNSAFDLPSGGWLSATTSNASTCAIMAYSVSGANGGGDKSNSTTATSTSTSLATGALTVANEIVFACLVFNGAEGVFTEASGFTTLAHFGTGGGHSFAYKIVSVTTTVSYAASWVSSVGYALAIGSVEATLVTDMPQSIGFFSYLYDQPDDPQDSQTEADQDAAFLTFINANRFSNVFTAAVAETGALADSPSAAVIFASVVAEAGTASDTPSAAAIFASTVTEAGGLVDVPSAAAVFASAVAESGSAADSPSGPTIMAATTAESLTAADTVSGPAVFARTIAEALSASDGPSAAVVFNASVGETLAATDTPSGSATLTVTVAETLNAVESTDADLVTTPGGGEFDDYLWRKRRR